MQKKPSFAPYFLIFLLFSLTVLFFSSTGFLKPVGTFLQPVFIPIQSFTYGTYAKIFGFGNNSEIQTLKAQNLMLTQKLVSQEKMIADNKALMDQFKTQNPKSTNLLPANVIAALDFIPGVSIPDNLIIDEGENDGVKVGEAVVYQDSLVGKISKTSAYTSNIELITNSSSSFTAEALNTQAAGVIKGQGGGGMILDNVILSDVLLKNDTVITKGDINLNGTVLPPNLVVGKITSISKNPSDLFQKAKVNSLLDFTNLEKVFVIVGRL